MPEQTSDAIEWALTQTFMDGLGRVVAVTMDTPIYLVDKVRLYFNQHGIEYGQFSYDDLR